MNDTTTRPAALRQLESRAEKARKARLASWDRVAKARAHLNAALESFDDALGRETSAFAGLCAARRGLPPEPAPPAPETLTHLDEGD